MGDRSPHLSLPTRRIAFPAEPPGHRGKNPDALRYQLEHGADRGIDVSIEHWSLIAAVASHRHAVLPPAAPVGAAIQPANRGDVTAARCAASQKGEVRDTRRRREAGNRGSPATALDHGLKVGKIDRGETRFSDVRAQSIDQQQETAVHTSSAIAGWLVMPP